MATSPFAIDWKSREQVIAYCKTFKGACVVCHTPGIPNYGITFPQKLDTPERKAVLVWSEDGPGPAYNVEFSTKEISRAEALAISNKFWGRSSK